MTRPLDRTGGKAMHEAHVRLFLIEESTIAVEVMQRPSQLLPVTQWVFQVFYEDKVIGFVKERQGSEEVGYGRARITERFGYVSEGESDSLMGAIEKLYSLRDK